MNRRSVVLTDELDAFVESRVQSGEFADANEVMVEALRTLERAERADESKMSALREAIEDGFASGVAEGDVFARVREKAGLPPRVEG
jgi:antitoxin ParD1/3/4